MPTSLPRDDLRYTHDEAAEALGIAERTLANWRNRREGPAFIKLPGKTCGAVYYRGVELRRWLEGRIVETTAA